MWLLENLCRRTPQPRKRPLRQRRPRRARKSEGVSRSGTPAACARKRDGCSEHSSRAEDPVAAIFPCCVVAPPWRNSGQVPSHLVLWPLFIRRTLLGANKIESAGETQALLDNMSLPQRLVHQIEASFEMAGVPLNKYRSLDDDGVVRIVPPGLLSQSTRFVLKASLPTWLRRWVFAIATHFWRLPWRPPALWVQGQMEIYVSINAGCNTIVGACYCSARCFRLCLCAVIAGATL